MEKKYYGCIDGLRTIAAIGIVMMHMKANNDYQITGFIYETVIGSFTDFVFLFMVISAFAMCVGYYKKVLLSNISISEFYKRRIRKTLPFFALLVLVDVINTPSIETIYEAFTNLTLMFGFLPNAGNISVIGVGWFLGLIFVFYLCFPFFCFLIENKKRAWIALGISIILNLVCRNYFQVGRQNILYSACYFLAGGLIYLYRDTIKINRYVFLLIVIITITFYYILGASSITCILVSSVLLMYAVISEDGILENRVTKFVGSISMEIYLSHMAIFRVIEKMQLNILFGNGWGQYLFTVCIVLCCTIVFSVLTQHVINMVWNKFNNRHMRQRKIS